MKSSLRLITLLVILAVLMVPAGLPAVSAAGAEPSLQLDKGASAPLPKLAGVDSKSISPLTIAPRSVQAATFVIDYVPNGTQNGDISRYTCETFPEEAKAALQAAANQLTTVINSSVPIRIEACWTGLPADVLEHSHPIGYSSWGSQLAISTVLSNAISGYDGASEASCTNNHYPASWCDDISLVISNSANFYYGTDGNPGNKIDLETVAMRGILHGLGFTSRAVAGNGVGYWGYFATDCTYAGLYDTFVLDGNGTKITNTSVYPCGSSTLASLLTGNNLYFAGPNAKAANGGNNIPLFAPSPWKPGGSYVHLANSFDGTPDALMTDSLAPGEAIHTLGPVTLAMLKDLGWGTYAISGQVTTSSGQALAGVTLSDGAGHTATTDENGNYTINNLPTGTYTITPSKVDYSFSPVNQYLSIGFADRVGVDFTANRLYIISGKFTLTNGTPLANIEISSKDIPIAYHPQFTSTDSNGNYSFHNLLPGSYEITPYTYGYAYSPLKQIVTISSADVTGVDFSAVGGYTLGGRVTQSDDMLREVGLSGVIVRDDAGHTATTDEDGYYAFRGIPAGTYTVTPSKPGYSFFPPSQNMIVAVDSSFLANFYAIRTTSISGTVRNPNGKPISDVTVSAGGWFTATTLSDGTYTINGLQSATYTLTPSKTGYTFVPTSRTVTVSVENESTGVDFTANFIPYLVSGRVAYDNGAPVAGILINTDTGYRTLTDTDGNYTLTLSVGVHKLMIGKPKHLFFSANQTVTVTAANQTGINFTATFHPEFRLFFMPAIQN